MSKRVHAVKVMFTDSELVDVQRQAIAQDMPVGEVVRRNCMSLLWGILGQADRRRQRNRGADEELDGADFVPSGFHDGALRR
jgi:hypothetical protein